MKVKHLALTLISISSIIIGIFVYFYFHLYSPFSHLPPFPWNKGSNELSFLYSFGNNDGENSLVSPLAIDIDEQGNAYVVDHLAGMVRVYDPNGKFTHNISRQGEGEGELFQPVGITFHENKVYVTEPSLGRIQVFDKDGNYLDTLIQEKAFSPVGINVTTDQTIIFTDVANNQVIEIDRLGKQLLTFGKVGNSEGQFQYPNDLVVNKQGQIFVSDSNNNRIQVFNRQGDYLFEFNGSNNENEKMTLPRGLDIDLYGRILVAEPLSNEVRMLDSTGNLLYRYVQSGSEDGSFRFPNGLRVFQRKIFIVDRENRRIQVFQ